MSHKFEQPIYDKPSKHVLWWHKENKVNVDQNKLNQNMNNTISTDHLNSCAGTIQTIETRPLFWRFDTKWGWNFKIIVKLTETKNIVTTRDSELEAGSSK